MRQRFIWIREARKGKGDFIPIEKLIGRPREATAFPTPYIQSDIAAYKSPLGDGVIDGRAAKREHHKRTGTRAVDPTEWKGGVRNHEFAKRWGMQPTGDPIPKGKRLSTTIDENWSE